MTDPHSGCALAIVGSRDVPNYQSASLVKQAILEHRPSVVISGGAKGVDQVAATVAHELGIMTLEFLPTTNQWDAEPVGSVIESAGEMGMTVYVPGGYKQRNTKVAEACDCLVRIASATTKTYGSGWTADHAERIGKRVTRHTV